MMTVVDLAAAGRGTGGAARRACRTPWCPAVSVLNYSGGELFFIYIFAVNRSMVHLRAPAPRIRTRVDACLYRE